VTDIAEEDGPTPFIKQHNLAVFIFYPSRVMAMYVFIEEVDLVITKEIFGVLELMVRGKAQILI
jgi:hypothetical protein